MSDEADDLPAMPGLSTVAFSAEAVIGGLLLGRPLLFALQSFAHF